MSDKPAPMLPWPAEDLSASVPLRRKNWAVCSTMSGRVMHRNWASIPHVTHHDDADITNFERRRKAWNRAHPDQKRALLPALVKASVAALQRYPQFNTSLSADGATLYAKQYFHIGIAVDVPTGLLVPVVRDCDKKEMRNRRRNRRIVGEGAGQKGCRWTRCPVVALRCLHWVTSEVPDLRRSLTRRRLQSLVSAGRIADSCRMLQAIPSCGSSCRCP